LFADPSTLAKGALAGLIFGFLLQRGGVTRYRVILGQFLLKDFTVLKIMLAAVVVGAVGIYGMLAMGLLEQTDLHIKPTVLLGNALGGVIFGVGMALLGYCPGTGVGAVADGSMHAIFGLLGMLVGAAALAEMQPWFKQHVLQTGDLGKVTLPSETGLSPWLFIGAIALLSVVGFSLLRRGKPGTEAGAETRTPALP